MTSRKGNIDFRERMMEERNRDILCALFEQVRISESRVAETLEIEVRELAIEN
jgi:hypothetical protein